MDSPPLRTVAVIGAGLIGTSIALALTARGVTVHLSDRDPGNAEVAEAIGAGRTDAPCAPVDLAVIAVPPTSVAHVLRECQQRGLARAYTDVASVKVQPWQDIEELRCDTASYVGGHPMAGRERSGPLAAQADLFDGRPWVLTPNSATAPEALEAAGELVSLCSGVPVLMSPQAHDRAVALVSHAPHVVASMTAARLEHAAEAELRLAGRGLRDVTRIAGGDPELWEDILAANAASTADVLADVAANLGKMVSALRMASCADEAKKRQGSATVRALLRQGREGHLRVPGKHGGPLPHYAPVPVRIGDRPGELARLFADVDATGVDIEDVVIDHSPRA
jgi:prephenate dehydrogenase